MKFRARIDVYHHVDPEVVHLMQAARTEIRMMRQELSDAIQSLKDEVTDSTNKIETVINNLPKIVEAAVTEAIMQLDVDETAAADAISAARDTVSAEVDKLLEAALVPDPTAPASEQPQPTGDEPTMTNVATNVGEGQGDPVAEDPNAA